MRRFHAGREAHPVTFRCLRLFCEWNDLRNVTPLNNAVVDVAGPVAIGSGEQWQANTIGSGSATVPGLTLDELVKRENLQCIHFLKMNIEGAEAAAVKGMDAVFRITQTLCSSCHDFRANAGDGEAFRTKDLIQAAVMRAGFE